MTKEIQQFIAAPSKYAGRIILALILLGFGNFATANHFLEVQVWKFRGLTTATYHTDVTFNTDTAYLAFGPEGVGEYRIPGDIVDTLRFPTSIPYGDPGTKEFWRIQKELVDEWNGKEYDLASRNCNHFVDAVIRRYGAGELPSHYFSRGDRLDQQIWQWTATGFGLTAEEASKLGGVWPDTTKAVTRPLQEFIESVPTPEIKIEKRW